MFDIIALDADDTLWENERLYTDAKNRFVQLLSRYESPEQIEAILSELEISNIHFYGYGIKSYILSMLEAAIKLSAGKVTNNEINQIISYGKDILTTEVRLFEHTQVTLEQLSAKYDLMLITKGEQREQEGKLQRSGLARHFRYVEVVVDKTTETYRSILKKYNLSPARFIMVGNSLRSDILPVLEIGGRAVYIPYENTWFHELETSQDLERHRFDEIQNLGQLPDYLLSLENS